MCERRRRVQRVTGVASPSDALLDDHHLSNAEWDWRHHGEGIVERHFVPFVRHMVRHRSLAVRLIWALSVTMWLLRSAIEIVSNASTVRINR